jgi:transcriptional regulator with XRE-family HTH domain
MDHDAIACDLLRALRGRRSQVAWSRRLGYRTNVAYPWESGRRSPTAAELFRCIERSGRDLAEGLTRFYGRPPTWIDDTPLARPAIVCRLLEDLRGDRTVTAIAAAAGRDRNAVSRWFLGHTQPRVPDFLRLIDATSVRLPDFVAAFVDPATLPSLAPLWARIEARRQGAARHPWTQAVLRAVELEAYRALPTHEEGWIARTLGIPLAEEQACLQFLELTGDLVWTDERWAVQALAVDTRRTPAVGRQLKAHWSQVAAERITAGADGQFSYNVFAVSHADFARIRELHLRYFHALRSIVAESTPGECVAVANVQLFTLDGDDITQK